MDGLHTHRGASLEGCIGEGERVGVLLAPAQTQATTGIHQLKMQDGILLKWGQGGVCLPVDNVTCLGVAVVL